MFQLNSMGKVEDENNTRLFVGNIPKYKTRIEILREFDQYAGKLYELELKEPGCPMLSFNPLSWSGGCHHLHQS